MINITTNHKLPNSLTFSVRNNFPFIGGNGKLRQRIVKPLYITVFICYNFRQTSKNIKNTIFL